MGSSVKAQMLSLLQELHKTESFTVAQAWEIRKAETQPVALDRLEFAWKALTPHFGGRDIASLKPLDFQNYVKKRTQGKKAVALSTVRRELGELSTTINHLVKTKRLSSLQAPYIPLPPPGKPRSAFLSHEDKELVLLAAAARREASQVPSRVELFCHIGWETGQRRRAIETLEWDQVDFEQKVIHFLKEGEIQTKKRKVSVPMSEPLLAVLSSEYERRETAYVLRSTASVRKSFDNLMAVCGLDHVTPHTLRHTFVSHLLMRDKSVHTVATLAGMTVKMVETTYGHLSLGHLRAALA